MADPNLVAPRCGGEFSRSEEVFLVKYKIRVEQSEEGWAASVPGLPGCWSQGATEAEALENVRVAISEYLRAVGDLLKDADVREIDVKV